MDRIPVMTKFILIICILFIECGIYTFSGSTIPGHLKTVNIPLFKNQSLQPDIAETITSELTKNIQQNNLLKPVANNSDATINGKVIKYGNNPDYYGSNENRDVNVSSYAVQIQVEVEFLDNKKDKELYPKMVITEEGIYDFKTETEKLGQQRAIEKIVNKIMQNSMQSW
jgi:hypothetical protein